MSSPITNRLWINRCTSKTPNIIFVHPYYFTFAQVRNTEFVIFFIFRVTDDMRLGDAATADSAIALRMMRGRSLVKVNQIYFKY